MFKKNSYIVCLITTQGSHCVKENYCFKQKIEAMSIRPCIDLKGGDGNGNTTLSHPNSRSWRYATQSEIEEYERLGKPFDVTTITNPEISQYEIY